MDQHSPTPDDRFVLESQIRECFGRAAYSHKTHEKMAERYVRQLLRVKWGQIILSAVTAGGAVGLIFETSSPWLTYATAIVATATLILNSYMKDLDPGELAQKHRETAADIWGVRESYLSLLSDCRDHSVSLNQLRTRRDELLAELHAIYRGSPHTDNSAYLEAQGALKNKEDLTFSELEIDKFLPEPLKRGVEGMGERR